MARGWGTNVFMHFQNKLQELTMKLYEQTMKECIVSIEVTEDAMLAFGFAPGEIQVQTECGVVIVKTKKPIQLPETVEGYW